MLPANRSVSLAATYCFNTCFHLSHPKNSNMTKWLSEERERCGHKTACCSQTPIKRTSATACHFHAATFRKITKQLLLVMTVTHPASLCDSTVPNPPSLLPPVINDTMKGSLFDKRWVCCEDQPGCILPHSHLVMNLVAWTCSIQVYQNYVQRYFFHSIHIDVCCVLIQI